MSSSTEPPSNTSLANGEGHYHYNHAAFTQMSLSLIEVVEFLSATSSAWFMNSYMNQVYPVFRPSDAARLEPSQVDLVPRSSQWMHLGACIVFGCSSASFLHRRKLYDPLQPYVFAVCICIGALAGELLGASADYIILVYISWAVCTAMLASSALSLRFQTWTRV
ncbi:hypothetical protein BGZ63DRAFT_422438 [Mariannaea sp. PMI_226]|nr:hypothetical protein BGZ63DRAFT_422438 [Mariannaea sp. PMI_226]